MAAGQRSDDRMIDLVRIVLRADRCRCTVQGPLGSRPPGLRLDARASAAQMEGGGTVGGPHGEPCVAGLEPGDRVPATALEHREGAPEIDARPQGDRAP